MQTSLTYDGTRHFVHPCVLAASCSSGKERDTESGLDYFGARYYGSSMGRFMSPDSSGYSGLTNPQSWNLYTYTLNNPLRYDDPTGHTVECKTDAAGCLSAARAAVGKDAAGQLTTETTTTQNWFQKLFGLSGTTTTTLQITGDGADFRNASGNASKLADLIDSKTSFGVSITSGSATPTYLGVWDKLNSSGGTFTGGISYTENGTTKALPESFISPYPHDPEAVGEGIPQANLGETFAHELLGHVWGEYFGGHPNNGSAGNKQDAVNAENVVRRTDPTRKQKRSHEGSY
jgi:RHS repeat-associated protein